MSDRAPYKPWRVYGARGMSTDFRSQRTAYEYVSGLTQKFSTAATVYHWERGSWRLYERVAAMS
jgi:hypothetical protein